MAMRGLRAAELARAAGREERLRSLLAAAACSVRAIYPSYGSVEFVELPFRNPYTSEHCFTVEWEDPLFQLSIVTDINEWRAEHASRGAPRPARLAAVADATGMQNTCAPKARSRIFGFSTSLPTGIGAGLHTPQVSGVAARPRAARGVQRRRSCYAAPFARCCGAAHQPPDRSRLGERVDRRHRWLVVPSDESPAPLAR